MDYTTTSESTKSGESRWSQQFTRTQSGDTSASPITLDIAGALQFQGAELAQQLNLVEM